MARHTFSERGSIEVNEELLNSIEQFSRRVADMCERLEIVLAEIRRAYECVQHS
jgi:hypothetical protein